jgi:hypothetical protein
MRAITACVQYDDYLKYALPTWLPYFDAVIVVTQHDDEATINMVLDMSFKLDFPVDLHFTSAFTDNGAVFNRGAAIEEALDAAGRHGWICHMDADIIMPPELEWSESLLECGNLYGMQRRLLKEPTRQELSGIVNGSLDHKQYPVRTEKMIYGYFQLFHGEDKRLGKPPWYSPKWIHCAHCDLDFAKKWPATSRRWLIGELLHLGPRRQNLMGRVTERLDGKRVDGDVTKRQRMREVWYRSNYPTQRRIGKLPDIQSPGE